MNLGALLLAAVVGFVTGAVVAVLGSQSNIEQQIKNSGHIEVNARIYRVVEVTTGN